MATMMEFLIEHNRVPTIEDKAWRYRGWLMWYMQRIAEVHPDVPDRYTYLYEIHETGKLTAPIPQIKFERHEDGMRPIANAVEILNRAHGWGWDGFREFVRWFGYALGTAAEYPDRVSDKAAAQLYALDFGPVLLHPYDYIGELAAEKHGSGWNPNAFYPTPHPVVECMVQMTFGDAIAARQDTRRLTCCDPCVGTGRMLLHASNYSLFLSGQDIDGLMCEITLINGALYAPWIITPPPPHLQSAAAVQIRKPPPRRRKPPPRRTP